MVHLRNRLRQLFKSKTAPNRRDLDFYAQPENHQHISEAEPLISDLIASWGLAEHLDGMAEILPCPTGETILSLIANLLSVDELNASTKQLVDNLITWLAHHRPEQLRQAHELLEYSHAYTEYCYHMSLAASKMKGENKHPPVRPRPLHSSTS